MRHPLAGSAGNLISELLAGVEVYPFTRETAVLAGNIDGEQRSKGIVIPFADLLIRLRWNSAILRSQPMRATSG